MSRETLSFQRVAVDRDSVMREHGSRSSFRSSVDGGIIYFSFRHDIVMSLSSRD